MSIEISQKNYLNRLLGAALTSLKIPSSASEFGITSPDPRFGDYATNAPLLLAKSLKRKSQELAEELAGALKNLDKEKRFSQISPLGGFINFHSSESEVAGNLERILKEGDAYGSSRALRGRKIMVEYTDPNPFKEFHIGHLMSNAIGEAIARIIETSGAKVIRANWQGDVGTHVAKAVWGCLKLKLELASAKPADLGRAYAYGAQAFEKDEAAREEITRLNQKIFSREDASVNRIYDAGRKISLAGFEEIYKRVGTKFDHYFFESKEGIEGKAIVETHLSDGVFEKSDGAIVFRGEKYGLHTRVFINSKGLPTYEAKELGLNRRKFELEPDLDRSIIVTGNEITEYFRVLLKVMSLIFPKIAEKTAHLPHGMLRLASGKMSSRTGTVVTAEGLIEQVKQKVLDKITKEGLSEAQKENIAEIVSIGAIKYSILRQDTGRDIIFDFEKSLAFEGDSGPYLQYTHARARSVLKKAALAKIKAAVSKEAKPSEVARHLLHFSEAVERAGSEFSPNLIANYLLELAAVFNKFYAREQIVDAKDPLSAHKVALTQAVAIVLKNGLGLLGIAAPEQM